jgi:membrane fusion protein, multidrug efflux system
MKKENMKKLFAAAVLSAVFGACSTPSEKSESPELPMSSKLPVDIRIVKSSPIVQETTIAGSVLPFREVNLMSEISKKISSVEFQEGSFVQKGDVLYRLESQDILAKLKQIQAELTLAKLNLKRVAQLVKEESVKQEEFDIAQTKVQSLEAAEELLLVELSKTSILAPFDGIVGITKAHPGALVGPGTELVNIQDHKLLKVQFSVPEKYLDKIKKGDTIKFRTAQSENQILAQIYATEPGIDPVIRSILVQALSNSHDNSIKPGMSAQVILNTSAKNTSGLSVPTYSLIPSKDGYSVFLVKKGMARLSPVKLGERNESEALILEGIADGDTLMVSNFLRAGDGVPVEVIGHK